MCIALLLPASQGFAQEQGDSNTVKEAAVEKPIFYVMVIESLPRSDAHSRFMKIKSVFMDVLEDQGWPISEVKVVRFGANTPEDAMVLKVFVTDWRSRIYSEIEFRCAVEFIHGGQKDKLGMIVGKHSPRPIIGVNSQEEAYRKAAVEAAKLIAEKLSETYFAVPQPE